MEPKAGVFMYTTGPPGPVVGGVCEVLAGKPRENLAVVRVKLPDTDTL